MTDADKARAWDEGYLAGIEDEVRCQHREWWLNRWLWRASGNRVSILRRKCFLYDAPNPYDPERYEEVLP